MRPDPLLPATRRPPLTASIEFTVHRRMALALVTETRDWYSDLVQAAQARIRLKVELRIGGTGEVAPTRARPFSCMRSVRCASRHRRDFVWLGSRVVDDCYWLPDDAADESGGVVSIL